MLRSLSKRALRRTTSEYGINDSDLVSFIRICLGVTAFLFLLGKGIFAACGSALALAMLVDGRRASTSRTLESWVLLSEVSCGVGIVSSALMVWSTRQDGYDALKLWSTGVVLQKVAMGFLAHSIYLDIFGSQTDPDSLEHSVIQCREIHVSVLAGTGLVPKDKNIWGKKTSSDPYAVIRHGSTTFGKTSVIPKTLDPVWQEECDLKAAFQLSVLPRALEIHNTLEINLFDHDKMSQDDPMGTVNVTIPTAQNVKVKRWYVVEKGEGENFCGNATGKILVEVELRSKLTGAFKRQLRQESQRRLMVEK